jgi:CubicO group peptidase (beta-lactamase class C family)
MQSCGADDASGVIVPDLAEGYAPQGVRDLARAPYLDWSAKTGNGSVYCTAADESKWIQGLMHDTLLSAQTRGIMLADSASHVGYGWFTGTSKRFGGPIYYMNGRSPGYASYLAYFPEQQITVVVLSNIYVSVTTQIGGDVAAIALGKPYAAAPPPMGPLDAGTLKGMQGRFSFGADFYQPDAVLTLLTQGGDVFLKWADGSLSPLIPVGPDHFIDRGYWEDVSLARGADGRIVQLVYDRFQGQRISEPAP